MPFHSTATCGLRRRMGFGPPAALLCALLWLAGCAGTPVSDRLGSAPPTGLPTAVELAETPFFPQTEYHCGPAAMAAALTAAGAPATPEGIADQLFTPGRLGTLQADMVTAARRNGRLPIPVGGMVGALAEVAAGHPVVVLQNLGLEMAPQWHYALLIGYDLEAKEAILRSGTDRRLAMPLATLEHTWRRGKFWGVTVVSPDGPVPETASAGTWLTEAAGLERAGRGDEAARAYRTAATRWPEEPAPHLALANLHYADGDLDGAEAALRAAVTAAPDDAAGLNNLAHVLLRRGKLAEAERMAERAVARPGPHRETAERTLGQIREERGR